jgi:hypothetical protein
MNISRMLIQILPNLVETLSVPRCNRFARRPQAEGLETRALQTALKPGIALLKLHGREVSAHVVHVASRPGITVRNEAVHKGAVASDIADQINVEND